MSEHFLGIDLGSSYTKFVVIDQAGQVLYREVIRTLSRRREAFDEKICKIKKEYSAKRICTTGYGRNSYTGDLKKTELFCASIGVSALHPEPKSIIDIGGEDIKIIESGAKGEILQFHMNDKCSAGTGAFITEIAEKAELDIKEMSVLAQAAKKHRSINSFCTVFAKTEILSWKFEGVPIEEIAQGIYLSIVDRVCKMQIRHDLPVLLCGGVIAYHPYLRELIEKRLMIKVSVVADPLYAVATGAAILAQQGGIA